ncbi:unnamed protein product [Dovyalis caffra]|uniref:Uncharacterized protein n=1 Tax=Dovyalis caffra TaxID=77055 RepID=A0AAV1SAX5_9ROSI|nr:unnamed protein product [Dovyalis caffra]
MNMSASQYISSGCESGWTSYLNESSNSKNQYRGFGGFVDGDYARVEGEQEEDLSMVSDASSGPPHYREDDEYCCDKLAKKSKNKRKSKEYGRSQQHSYLDDTASSPALGKATNNEGPTELVLESSQGFSATHFKNQIYTSACSEEYNLIFNKNVAESNMSNMEAQALVDLLKKLINDGYSGIQEGRRKQKEKLVKKRLWSFEEQSVSTLGIDDRGIRLYPT